MNHYDTKEVSFQPVKSNNNTEFITLILNQKSLYCIRLKWSIWINDVV